MVSGSIHSGPCPSPAPTTSTPSLPPSPQPTDCNVEKSEGTAWTGTTGRPSGSWSQASNWQESTLPAVGMYALVESLSTNSATQVSVDTRSAKTSRLQVQSNERMRGARVSVNQTSRLVISGNVVRYSVCPTPDPSPTPTLVPSVSILPSPEPSPLPTSLPTSVPSPEPVITPSIAPTYYETPCDGIRLNATRDEPVEGLSWSCLNWNLPGTWDTNAVPHVGDEVVVSTVDAALIPCVSVSSQAVTSEASKLIVDVSTATTNASTVRSTVRLVITGNRLLRCDNDNLTSSTR